jgi:hypothetical protein
MGSSSCGALAYMLGARFGMRVAEDGRLTFLIAHAASRRLGAWHVKSGCCWLLQLPTPNASQCRRRGLQGPCIDRGPCVEYLITLFITVESYCLRFLWIILSNNGSETYKIWLEKADKRID